jgi:hypothetical protein
MGDVKKQETLRDEGIGGGRGWVKDCARGRESSASPLEQISVLV